MLRIVSALLVFAAFLAAPAVAQPVTGAGSSFAYPAIARWSQTFQSALKGDDFVSSDAAIDYEPIGSLAGTMRLGQPELDFAATDAPLPGDDLRRLKLVQFPVVMGGIAIIANLPGVERGRLHLDGPLLAALFSGRIARWNDPALSAANPGLNLPDLAVSVVHRSDGSGTTLNFTRFLAAVDPRWKAEIGSDTQVRWPSGSGRDGSSRLLQAVQATPGAVGYVEFGQALRSTLTFASIRNAAGAHVAPSPESLRAAALNADWAGAKDFNLLLVDVPGADSYPLAASTFILMPASGRSAQRIGRTLMFFRHALEHGGADAAALGYVPLPDPLVRAVRDSWRQAYPTVARY